VLPGTVWMPDGIAGAPVGALLQADAPAAVSLAPVAQAVPA
jgi:hypothetical protein